MEKWKDIIGYEGLYEVSTMGQVRNKITKKNLVLRNDYQGYFRCNLYKNRKCKTYRVHRLVAETFSSNIECKRTVDHINGIKSDNRLENLKWASHKEQMNNPCLKVNRYCGKPRGIKVIMVFPNGDVIHAKSYSEAAKILNVSYTRILDIFEYKRPQLKNCKIFKDEKESGVQNA